jgi:hypothetical protein
MVATAKGQYLDVRDFEPADYHMVWDEVAVAFPHDHNLHPSKWAEGYAAGGPAFTGWWQGDILACAGLLIVWPGLASAWAVITRRGRDHPVMIHRTTQRFLDANIQRHRLRRVEATAFESDRRAQAWLARLGFEVESVRPEWGPSGQTGLNFVRFTHDWH